MYCRICNIPMKHIMRFQNKKSLELETCPKCHIETKAVPIKYMKNQYK